MYTSRDICSMDTYACDEVSRKITGSKVEDIIRGSGLEMGCMGIRWRHAGALRRRKYVHCSTCQERRGGPPFRVLPPSTVGLNKQARARSSLFFFVADTCRVKVVVVGACQ